MNQDWQHLKLLSLFHYIVGGLLAFFSCFLLIYLLIGVVFVAAPPPSSPGAPPPPPELGWFFILFSGAGLLLGWSVSACVLLAGWFLRRCKHYLFCMVVACIVCLFQPFGTVLGVFTIIVLIRPSVKERFASGGLPPESDDAEEPPSRYDKRIARDSTDFHR